MTYRDNFADHLLDHATITEGVQHRYRFTNDFGASVIQHETGPFAGKWELAMLQFDGDECRGAHQLGGAHAGEILIFWYDDIDNVSEQLQVVHDGPRPTGIEADFVIATDNQT